MFIPWVGKEYEQQTLRTLILGESHYGNHHVTYGYPLEEKTVRSIQEQIISAWPSRFHTKVVATMIGHLPSREEKLRFWNSVAYHNLIAEPLTGSRVAPTERQWSESVATLDAVMGQLKPAYCVCLGYRMWAELWRRVEHTPVQAASDVGPKGAFWSERFQCVFHGLKHPSGRGFRRADWHRYVTNLRREKWASAT